MFDTGFPLEELVPAKELLERGRRSHLGLTSAVELTSGSRYLNGGAEREFYFCDDTLNYRVVVRREKDLWVALSAAVYDDNVGRSRRAIETRLCWVSVADWATRHPPSKEEGLVVAGTMPR